MIELGWIGRGGAYSVRINCGRAVRAIVAQVGGERLTHLDRQREPIPAACLAPHRDLPAPPVDVTQLQGRDLPGAKPSRASRHKMA